MNKTLVVVIVEIIIIGIVICQNCIKDRKVMINHYFCFSVGYLYYGIIPFLVFECKEDFNDYVCTILIEKYQEVPTVNITKYLILSFFMYFSFLLGSRVKEKRICRNDNKSFRFSEQIFFAITFLLGICLLFFNKNFLFRGYNGQKNMNKGSLSAYLIVLCTFVLFNIFSVKKSNLKKWFIILVLYSMFLLSMGGRLYVMTAVFSLLICKTKFITKGFSVKKILTIFLLLLLAAGGIGVMRQGRELVFSKVIFNLLQEPIYTSYSVVTYLQNNRIEKLLEFPDITLSGFVNLIPYKLFPEKINYMASVYTKGNGIQAPLGATHFFVSYILDYGIIGSIILFFMIGKCIAFLSEGTQNYLKKTVYCLVSANLMFTFFRDAIAIAIIKNVLEFSVLMPVGIYGINYLLETTVRKS